MIHDKHIPQDQDIVTANSRRKEPPANYNFKEWALWYASRGFKVFPLCEKDKFPKIPKDQGGNGCHDATKDKQQIEAWWDKYPNANIGIATGSGLFVLDIDDHPEIDRFGFESLRELESENGQLPDTWTVITGSQGEHRYYLIKEPSNITIAKNFRSGLDYRCNDGYVVAPPSIHPNGNRYEFEASTDFSKSAAWVSQWLPDLILSEKKAEKEKPTEQKQLEEKIIEGGRNDTLFRLACSLRRKGLSEKAIYAAVSATNTDRCKPPLEDKEVRTVCHHAATYYEAGDIEKNNPKVVAPITDQSAREYISTLTEDDFYTAAPYDYIASIDNDQLRSSVTQLARRWAKECKINLQYFDEQIAIAARNASAPSEDDEVTAALPKWLYTGDWTVSSKGVKRPTEKSWLSASRLPVYISKRYADIDDDTTQVELTFMQAEEWKSIITPLDTLSTNTKACTLHQHGLTVTSDNASAFVTYMSQLWDYNYGNMPVGISTKRCGYSKQGFIPYCADVTFTGDGGIKQLYDAVSEYGSHQTSLETIGKIRSMSMVARIMIAASLAAPLLKPMRLLPFVVHAWSSQSGTGKTVALMAAASLWANPSQSGRYIQNFNSTATSMAVSLRTLCNLPLCMDELQLVKDAATLQNMIYLICEGHERSRGTVDANLRADVGSWNTVAITTGEMPVISDGGAQGSINRCIEIEVPTGETVIETGAGNQLVNLICDNYGTIGPEWLRIINTDEIKTLHAEYMAQLLSSGISEKQAASAAILCAADVVAGRLLWQDRTNTDMVNYMATHLPMKSESAIGVRAYRMTQEWIVAHQRNFDTDYATEVYGERVTSGGICYTLIIPSVLKSAFVTMGFAPNQYKSILREWADADFIRKSPDGRTTINARIDGRQLRCVWFKWIPPES